MRPLVIVSVAVVAVGVAAGVGASVAGGDARRPLASSAAPAGSVPLHIAAAPGADQAVESGAPVTPPPTTSTPSRPPASATPTPARTKPRPAATTSAPQPRTDDVAAMEAAVVTLVNQERSAADCQPMTVDSRLATAARKHSADMAARGYFSHDTPEGVGFATRITNAGYPWSGAAENIAKGQRTPADVMRSWMDSPGHRANILNCGLRDIGVGLAFDGRTPVWTQDFGTQR